MRLICTAIALGALSACVTADVRPTGPRLFPALSTDQLVEVTTSFIAGVIEGCVDSMLAGKSIAELHAGSDAFVLETSPEARLAAGLKSGDAVWRPEGSAGLVTMIESTDGCTVGANGPPLAETYANLSLALMHGRGFSDPKFSEGGPLLARHTLAVGPRNLGVLMTGQIETATSISNLMVVVSWSN